MATHDETKNGAFALDDLHRADVESLVAIGAGVTEERLHEELARPFARVRVVRGKGGRAIAFMLVWNVTGEVHVLDIAVHPSARRRGIARALMMDALGDACARGAEHMYLEVRRSNAPAIALYRSLGFYAANVRRSYYPDGEDAIDMTLAFEPATGEVARGKDEVKIGDE